MKRTLILTALLITLPGCGPREQSAAPAAGTADPATATETTAGSGELSVGSPMRNFQLEDLEGRSFEFAQMQGRPVLLNLWATWCGPCRAEIPELQRLHDEHEAEGFAVLGVSVDEAGSRDEIVSFLAERNVSYPNVHDPEGSVAEMFNAYALPTSVLIDRTGKIVWKKIGIIRFEDPELKKAMGVALAPLPGGSQGAVAPGQPAS